MELRHYLMLAVMILAGYYVGRHYPLNLPLLG